MKRPGLYTLVAILLLSFACPAIAQDYLVTTKGDTIRGEIKPQTFGADKKVQVVGSDKKKTIYPMFQIRNYRLKDATYQPVKGPDGYAFMKVVKGGYLTLFAFQLPNQVAYDGQYLMKKDGRGTEVPNLTFKKIMKNFLEDCPSVVDRIETGDLGKKELLTIVDEYNACIQVKTVDHSRIVASKAEAEKKISAWDVLEEKVKAEADFSGKSNALEMIQDIKGKISRGEKIPNFLLEGLKSSLTQDALKTDLANALKEVN
ncbi:hypothetical protein [Chryseolinea lacunae]|uniref:DUF4369 domain-containing protein n=1 Tax=Chryseolinea lacunae TaxID=2801331 RepID=A0ABS1L028_9BACT|nr:hypothetical protein [Chryseolinea lacunae]MBL0744950.1 hypothetical protein [Chryseolinea lacunae]